MIAAAGGTASALRKARPTRYDEHAVAHFAARQEVQAAGVGVACCGQRVSRRPDDGDKLRPRGRRQPRRTFSASSLG